MNPIRFALIGVGGIGAYHLRAIEMLERAGSARLVMVADPTVDRLGSVRDDLTARGVRWHLDYRDMLAESDEFDAVTIATPIPFHFEMTLACLERGLFVNLEKPPVPLIQQLDQLIEADRKERVSVGFQWIGSKCVQQLKRLAVDGALGTIEEIRIGACWPRGQNYYERASWAGRMTLKNEPVFDGPVTNALAHLIHNLMFLASPEQDGFEVPVEVQGELYRARPIESYDAACLRGRFASGITFSAALAHPTRQAIPFQIEVKGTGGSARISNDGALLQTSSGTIEVPEDTAELINKTYLHFADFVCGRRPRPETRLCDARGYVLATNGMLVSSGGCHDIGAQWISEFQNNGDRGLEVAGLAEAVTSSMSTGKLFSELSVPWAVHTKPVQLDSVKSVSLEDYLQAPDPSPA